MGKAGPHNRRWVLRDRREVIDSWLVGWLWPGRIWNSRANLLLHQHLLRQLRHCHNPARAMVSTSGHIRRRYNPIVCQWRSCLLEGICRGNLPEYSAFNDRQPGWQHPWKGSIGEVSVYSTTLTAFQIQQHYNPLVLGSVTIDLMQGTNPTPLQTLTSTALDTGAYLWTVPALPGNNYQIRITLNQPAVPRHTSDDYFEIVLANHDYYVSPTGNDANSGKSVDQPMASIPAAPSGLCERPSARRRHPPCIGHL